MPCWLAALDSTNKHAACLSYSSSPKRSGEGGRNYTHAHCNNPAKHVTRWGKGAPNLFLATVGCSPCSGSEVKNFEAFVGNERERCAGSEASTNFSSLPTPFRRLSQIRCRKKKTRDEMFSEIMEVTRNERAHLNEWKDVVLNYRKDASEREDRRDQREERRDARDERWQQEDQRCRQEDQQWWDATLGLLRNQTDMIRRLVEHQEQQQDHRMLLQPLCNHPHHVPYPPHPDV